MYGFQDYNKITPEQVLQKVSQEEIFQFVLGKHPDSASRFLSPFRIDKKANCRFEVIADGTLLFVDFGDKSTTHRTCFKAVMDKYGIILDSAVNMIVSHFELSSSEENYVPVTKTFTIEKADKEEKESTIITYDIVPYAKRDKLHWSQFLITPSQLLEDNVYSTNKYYLTRNGVKRGINLFTKCYAIDFITRVKLYQPSSVDYRWITNCDENNIGNFDNLPLTSDVLLIKKSYKDHRVIRNLPLDLNVVWFQNEGCIPDIYILINIAARFKKIVVFYDNDEAGVKAAIRLVSIFNNIREDCASMIHLPVMANKTRQWKDPAQFISKEGSADLLVIFKQLLEWQNIVL